MILNPHEYSQLVCGEHEYNKNRFMPSPQQIGDGKWLNFARHEENGQIWGSYDIPNYHSPYNGSLKWIENVNAATGIIYRMPNPDELINFFETENVNDFFPISRYENVWSVVLSQEWIDKQYYNMSNGYYSVGTLYCDDHPLCYNIANKNFHARQRNNRDGVLTLAVC